MKRPAQPDPGSDALIPLSRLVSSISHDINNLLVGVIGNSGILMQDESLPPQRRALVGTILQCAKRMQTLTDRVLSHPEIADQQPIWSEGGAPRTYIENEPRTEARPKLLARQAVLVIDDELVVREVCAAGLAKEGVQVLSAASGEEGLRLFETHHEEILCVFLDLSMPFVRGNLVYAKLKAIDPVVKVFLMSGYLDSQARYQFGVEGIEGFIHKPFESEDLMKAIRSCGPEPIGRQLRAAN